ncbi:conserved protein of unknown function (plasmid) [Shinella sp. WSC3-e]|nr:conserved hypothetical protein [Rhizobiaceae bacterium]CAK7261836.1 conserved protein of unknown function [Shinella sp. WSC3-e]
MRSGLRLNSARDIEHGPLLLDIDRAAGPEFSGMRRRCRMPVGHREDDVRRVLARKGELDDLLERHRPLVHRAEARVDDDLKGNWRLRSGDETLDAGAGQIEQFVVFDQTIFTALNFEEDRLVITRLGQAIEDRAADNGLAPAQFVVIEDQLEVAVRLKSNETFSSAFAQIEGLVQAHVLEIARGQNRKKTVTLPRVEGGSFEQLTSERQGIGHLTVLKIEIALSEEEAINPRRTKRPAFAQRIADIVKFKKFLCTHRLVP